MGKKFVLNREQKQFVGVHLEGYTEGTCNSDFDFLNTATHVAIDYETTGVNPYDNDVKLLSIAFSVNEGYSVTYVFEEGKDIPENIINALQREDLVKLVASRPFEESLTYSKLGFKMGGPVHDVLVLAHLLDENDKRGYNLENVASRYGRMDDIKDVAQGMRTNLAEADREVLVQYNGVDTDATLRSYNTMIEMLKRDRKLLKYYVKFVKPVQDMFSDVRDYGFTMDVQKLRDNEAELSNIVHSLQEECINIIPESIREEHRKKGLKLTRAALIVDYMFTHKDGLRLKPQRKSEKTGKPQTSEAHLKMFAGVPFVDTLLRYKKAQKVLSTYFKQVYQSMNQDDKIYPNTLFTRTVTGRTVILNPTIQTIPQHSEFARYVKEAFAVPEGWVFAGRDLAQSELRIIGWFAQDGNILNALDKGIDLHTKTASVVNNVPVEKVTKDMRRPAKPVNFGFVYGMQASSFARYAKDNYGVEFSEKEAVKVRQQFFAKPNGYYKLPVYHEHMKKKARQQKYVESILGRKRRLPDIVTRTQSREAFGRMIAAERQSINFPVQSFSSDLALLGMLEFYYQLKRDKKLGAVIPLWFIHDANMFMCREEEYDYAMDLLKECMDVRAGEYIKKHWGIEIGYPVESDGKYGPNWNDMTEVS